MKNRKRAVMSLNSDSFKHYLLLSYVNNSVDPKWKQLTFVAQDKISAEVWLQLYNHAKADVESQGGGLTGYEVIDERVVKHEKIKTDYWPANWMWVISKQS
ncbi:hypothetical protein [Dyadobacter crusticola]|uniref:hypothetical protein n=1 Tax=Dyadobacter crusticola TaxID=292407 RepID=UPI0004E282AC|nr:hypothetical protein [Dyadobacter crusticola]